MVNLKHPKNKGVELKPVGTEKYGRTKVKRGRFKMNYITRKDGRKTILIKKDWINNSGYYGRDIRLNPRTGFWEEYDYNTGFERAADYKGKRYGKTRAETKYMIAHGENSQDKY